MSELNKPDYDGPLVYEGLEVKPSAFVACGGVRIVFDGKNTIDRFDLTRKEAFELMMQIGEAVLSLPEGA